VRAMCVPASDEESMHARVLLAPHLDNREATAALKEAGCTHATCEAVSATAAAATSASNKIFLLRAGIRRKLLLLL
jgi:hypothetical protein